jgi:hypothetical protein
MKYGIDKEQKKRSIVEKAQRAAEAISGELRRQALQAKEEVDKAVAVEEQRIEEKLQEKNEMVAAETTELQFAISVPSPWKQEHFSVCTVSRPVGHRRCSCRTRGSIYGRGVLGARRAMEPMVVVQSLMVFHANNATTYTHRTGSLTRRPRRTWRKQVCGADSKVVIKAFSPVG